MANKKIKDFTPFMAWGRELTAADQYKEYCKHEAKRHHFFGTNIQSNSDFTEVQFINMAIERMDRRMTRTNARLKEIEVMENAFQMAREAGIDTDPRWVELLTNLYSK